MDVKKISYSLAIVHILSVLFVYLMPQPTRDWFWVIFLIVDFPISLLTLAGWNFMLANWGDIVWEESWRHTIYNGWPFIVHFIIGSLWWGFIPFGIKAVIKRLKTIWRR